MKRSRQAAYADSTHKVHKVQWKTYIKFCLFYNFDLVPVSAENLSLFAQFLARSFVSPSTIKNYISGAKLLHIIMQVDTKAFETYEFKLTIKGITRRLKHMPRQASPITPALLLQFRKFLDLNNPADASYWSLFLTAFFAMARKSNLVPASKNSFDPEKQLSRSRVLVGEDCLLVIWSWAKNIQKGDRMHKMPLLSIRQSPLCPVLAYKNMCSLVKVGNNQPAFSVPAGKGHVPITYSQFNRKLKHLVSLCGLNPDVFSTHSFRRGGATYAFQADVPETLIQLQGDWASDCYKRYLKMGMAEKKLVSLRMGNLITASLGHE